MQLPETAGLGLLDYLVKPFQRILKYPLLIRVFYKILLLSNDFLKWIFF